MLNLQATKVLIKSEIKDLAPSIYTDKGSPSTSEKYAHISTDQVISDMELLGWGVVDVKEVKARKSDTVGYQKHLVVFRNPEITITSEDGDDVFPQVLLTNSHDGKNAFTFKAGLFRLVCENGLVISTQEFSDMKIRHYGYSFEELQETIKNIVEKLPLTVEALNKFKQVQLGQEQALEFAQRSLSARFSDTELEHIKVDLNELLKPTRVEDKGSDLWSVFNVIQEKIVHGMFDYQYGVKARKARKIKNFKQDMLVNEKLFGLAMEYAQVAA
jgi:hypothetical protein